MKRKRILQAALRAARRGWPVLPLHGVQNGRCMCGDSNCSSVGKHPSSRNGVQDATTDEDTIRSWFAGHAPRNWGIATGRESGLVVVDVDPRHGGVESLKELEAEYGPLPDGPRVHTGGNGLHIYFRHPGGIVKSRAHVLPGIDVRGDGGYVVGTVSRHRSGLRYLWQYGKTPTKISVPLLPEGLRRLLEAKPHSLSRFESVIPEGRRNATLTSLAGVMRSRGFTRQAIEAALLEDNRLRCDPPLSDREVINIARSVARYSPGSPEIISASATEEVKKERKNLQFLTGQQIASETPAAIRWLAAPYVAFGATTEIDGKVKLAGKTTFVTFLTTAVLNGSTFLGSPTTKTKAVYLTEQPMVSFRAAMERAGLLGSKKISVLFWAETIGMPWSAVAEAAIAECKRKGAKLLIVDTLPQFAGLLGDSENNAGDALKALRPLQKAAAEGIAVVIVRHERKSGGALGDSGRGSSAFAGAVDVVMSLRRPEGSHRRNVRLLQAVSRLGDPGDLLIELTDGGYKSLGAPGDDAKAQAVAEFLSYVPKSKKKAATIEELAQSTNKSRAQLQKLVDGLVEAGEIVRLGKGRKSSAFRYCKA